jgi:hypothetical protein
MARKNLTLKDLENMSEEEITKLTDTQIGQINSQERKESAEKSLKSCQSFMLIGICPRKGVYVNHHIKDFRDAFVMAEYMMELAKFWKDKDRESIRKWLDNSATSDSKENPMKGFFG